MTQEINTKLNPAQQQAVDSIEGPVLVLAGPGTGKTQLLSARVANILNSTDLNPSNILCLTYTEAGVSAMKSRLAKTIGASGYQVSIHTFHSFALEVMRRFPDYFLNSHGFSPIDDLTKYQILEHILQNLPPNFKLAHRSFAREGRISDLTTKISELKKAGLTPQNAKDLAQKNQQDLKDLQSLLSLIPDQIPRAKTEVHNLIQNLVDFLQTQNQEDQSQNVAIEPLKNIILKNLADSTSLSLELAKSTPITNFKNTYLEKDSTGKWCFKDSKYNQNLKELAQIYQQYEEKLLSLEKLEFDDMILNLISALQNNTELKLNVQEQWQYILVDEFQDTNFAQLEIIKLLGDNPTNHGQPNIMVVGDDDQAIYAFQGASVSNIQTFLELFPQTKIITLQDNYRSNQNILEASIQTAQQIEDRPTGTKLKLLQPQNKQIQNLEVEVVKLTDLSSELNWLTEDLKQQLKNGAKSEDIAVLAPKHKYLQELATTLQAAGIPVFYETSTNILEDEIIQELLSLSKLVLQIGAGDLASSNSLLAEVLSAPYWQLEPGSVWNLAVFASQQELKQHWLQHLKNGALGQPGIQIYHQLTFWGTLAQNLSLEQSLDLLIGVASNPPPESIPLPRERLGEGLSESIPPLGGHLTKGEGVGLSPFKNFYFSHTKLKQNPAAYANFLASLSSLRDHLRSYYPDQSSTKLKDLITYTDLCQAHGGIRLARSGLHIKPSGVNLITAYGSKGLEFDQVYLIHCLEDVWGQSARGKTDTLKLSSNFGAHQDSADDKTRLFYVAQTRAKTRLVQTLYKFDEKGKPKTTLRYLEPLSSLIGIKLKDFSEESLDAQESAQAYQQTLFNPPASIPLPRKACPELAEGEGLGEGESDLPPQLANILQPLLQNYRLSPTHLNTWLDEEYGGPEEFITRHLLRFPQAMSESAIHGSAVHKALEKAHLSSKGSAKENSLSSLLLTTYQTELNKSSLDPQTRSRMLQKAEFLFNNLAEDILSLVSVNAKSEVDIKANFGEVKLSGKLDAIVITKEDSGEQTAIIRDYKTGKPKNKIEERYKHQLYFYKLLLDLAPERLPKNTKLKGAELVYLHPTEESIVTLSLEYNQEEYEQFKKLIKQTWTEIMNLGLG